MESLVKMKAVLGCFVIESWNTGNSALWSSIWVG